MNNTEKNNVVTCVMCGSSKELKKVKEKDVCKSCILEIVKL